MSTVTLRRLRPELAAQLGELELAAAVLERDTRNGRAILVELGIDLPLKRRRLFSLTAVRATLRATLQAAPRAVIRFFAWTMRAVRSPRLTSALRIVRQTITDLLASISLACLTLLSLTLAILLVAPPDWIDPRCSGRGWGSSAKMGPQIIKPVHTPPFPLGHPSNQLLRVSQRGW